MSVCVGGVPVSEGACRVQKRSQPPWSWSYRWLWMLGTELGSSGRAASTLTAECFSSPVRTLFLFAKYHGLWNVF